MKIKARLLAAVLAVGMGAIPFSGCTKKADAVETVSASTESVQKKTQEEKNEPKQNEYFSEEEVKALLEKYIQKEKQDIENLKNLEKSERADLQNNLLETLQIYYMSTDEYTSEEQTVGSIITSSVADKLSGGSSTIAASIQSAAAGIKSGESAGELITDAFSSAMEEVSQEIVSRVFEYMAGETVMKAYHVLEALIPQNEQTQHLTNLMDRDIKTQINELVEICSQKELTIEECYRGEMLCDALLQTTYEIEVITGLNAGSNAWRPFYQSEDNGNYVSVSLNSIHQFVAMRTEAEETLKILENLDMKEIMSYTPEKWDKYQEKLEEIRDIDSNEALNSSLSMVDGLDEEIKGVYDLEDAWYRSQDTNFMNSVGKLIGNPISDILILKKNQSEEILADALAEYNAEAIPIWRKRFSTIKQVLVDINRKKGMFAIGTKGETDVEKAVRMEALKQIWGEEPSDEKIRKDIAPLTKDIFVILHLTEMMRNTFYTALSDSDNNKILLRDYSYAENMLWDVYYLGLSQIDMMNGDNSFFYQTVYKDKDYEKLAELSYKLVKTYADYSDKTDDLYWQEETKLCDEKPVHIKALVKSPVNGTENSRPMLITLEQEGEGKITFFGYHSIVYICVDETNQKVFYPGLFSDHARDLYWEEKNHPEDITQEFMEMYEIDGIASTFTSWLSIKDGKFKDDNYSNLSPYFHADLSKFKADIQKYHDSTMESKRYNERIKKIADRIEKEAQKKDSLWRDRKKVEEAFLSNYVVKTGYEKLCDSVEPMEEEGFGTLTLVHEPENNDDAWIYRTSAGKQIEIRLYYFLHEGKEYKFWWPHWEYDNWILSDDTEEVFAAIEGK